MILADTWTALPRIVILLLGCWLSSAWVWSQELSDISTVAPKVLKVGGYEFPPFVDEHRDGSVQGMSIELIGLINALQDDYRLEYFHTSSKRRYLDFKENRYDVILFENKRWGWQDMPVVSSKVFMGGGEVYIAYRGDDRDQRYFDSLSQRRIVGLLGYHYGFADYNADEEYLSRNFRILLSADPLRNIKLILLNRPDLAEVAVVTKAYLQSYFKRFPEDEYKLLVSEQMDQTYEHTILIRDDLSLGIETVNDWLEQLAINGELTRLKAKYGITE